MRRIFYILLSLLLFLTACGSAKKMVVVAPKAAPSWYSHPPLSNATYLYAVGDGKSKQEALSNALAALLATLSVSISSKYSAKTVIKEGTHHNSSEATYINKTESEVKKIRITNYKVLESYKFGFKHYSVLVEVEREKFFRSLKKELTQQFMRLQTKEKNLIKANALQRVHFYKEALDSLNDLQNRLNVMSVLQPDFQSDSFIKRYLQIQKRYDRVRNSISFWVVSNVSAFVPVIAKGLTQKSFVVSQHRRKNHFKISLHADIVRAEAYGIILARANVVIKTKDSKGNILGSNSFNLIGRSSQSYSIAKQDLVKNLNSFVEQKGIAKVLNIEI